MNTLHDLILIYIKTLFYEKQVKISGHHPSSYVIITLTKLYYIRIDIHSYANSVELSIQKRSCAPVDNRYVFENTGFRYYGVDVTSPYFNPDIKFKRIKKALTRYCKQIYDQQNSEFNKIKSATKKILKGQI